MLCLSKSGGALHFQQCDYLCCVHCAVLQETPCVEEPRLLQRFCQNIPCHDLTSPLRRGAERRMSKHTHERDKTNKPVTYVTETYNSVTAAQRINYFQMLTSLFWVCRGSLFLPSCFLNTRSEPLGVIAANRGQSPAVSINSGWRGRRTDKYYYWQKIQQTMKQWMPRFQVHVRIMMVRGFQETINI